MSQPTALPDGLRLSRTTPTFDETSVPTGLLAAHTVADDVWGRLVVLDGSLDFVFEDDSQSRHRVGAGEIQIIPPMVRHHVEVHGPVRFHVEFHR